ncbi:DNA replication factor Cdt1 [Lampris incognitus]|uniref:DNA replication factor Cdt1 n=1 Tax=Lampris incognitus TaxID=2546036 RepID=UPI0024B48B3F|nr:DNA replication factor Cdt1 [Lampris incognitus]
MAQSRVTDYFSQRKHSGIETETKGKGPKTTARHRSVFVDEPRTRTRSKNTDKPASSNSVHEEFLRVIEEASGTHGGQTKNAAATPSRLRTQKRPSADAGCEAIDLGATMLSTTTEHSTPKRRRLEVKTNTTRIAEKKLNFCRDSGAVEQTAELSGVAKPAVHLPANPGTQGSISPHGSQNTLHSAKGTGKTTALSKNDVAALRSRLHKIKKQAEKLSSAAPPSSSCSTVSIPEKKPLSRTPDSTTAEAVGLKATIARAKELAVIQKKKKTEKEDRNQTDSHPQDSDQVPAYQRYHTLAQPAAPGLTLPYQYKLLAEMFRCLDTIVGMLYNRSEIITFAKVKQGVQDMMRKRFEESHLGQIKTVFPDAYTFRQEKNIPNFSCNIKKGSYQLTLDPVIHSDQNEARPLLLASRLVGRRCIFHQNLVSIVKQHHKNFLSSLVPPMFVPEDKLTRWHPRFNVDTVPAVQISPLPQPPHAGKLSTAQEVLDKARSLMTPKMEKALAQMALKMEEAVASKESDLDSTLTSSTVTPTAAPPEVQVPSALKGVSQSLLDRIRAKEAQKLQVAMTRDPAKEERLLMMSRLGDLARFLRNLFVSEKKPALVIELVCTRMVASYGPALSTGEMEKHIHMLAELAPDWLTIHKIRKDFYLKLDKNMELNDVVNKLNTRLREAERV